MQNYEYLKFILKYVVTNVSDYKSSTHDSLVSLVNRYLNEATNCIAVERGTTNSEITSSVCSGLCIGRKDTLVDLIVDFVNNGNRIVEHMIKYLKDAGFNVCDEIIVKDFEDIRSSVE